MNLSLSANRRRRGADDLARRSSGPPPWPTGGRGFSLPELLASLAVLALVAGVGVYLLNTGGWRDSAVAADMVGRLDFARSRAVLEQNNYVVTFDAANQQYHILDDNNSNGVHDASAGETRRTYRVAASGGGVVFGCPQSPTPPAPVSTSCPASGLSATTLTFTPLGTATTLDIYVIPQLDLDRNDRTRMRALSVNAATGRIRRWRYDATAGTPPWRLER